MCVCAPACPGVHGASAVATRGHHRSIRIRQTSASEKEEKKTTTPPSSSATPGPWEPPRPWQPVSPGSGPVLEEPQGQRLPRMVENSPWAADKALIAASSKPGS